MGVTKELIQEGDGKTFPKTGDELTMHCARSRMQSSPIRCARLTPTAHRRDADTGTLTRTGVKFDSSVDKNKPFIFKIGIGMGIKGWDEGGMQMWLGGKATLKVSSDFGYGEKGAGMVIPPNADLTFEVELLGINGTMAPGYGTSCSSCVLQ